MTLLRFEFVSVAVTSGLAARLRTGGLLNDVTYSNAMQWALQPKLGKDEDYRTKFWLGQASVSLKLG
jgi:hypothetical protein